jgi:ankyrin repeat protein
MNSEEHDSSTIEIDDDIWDVVCAMVAFVCEVDCEPYWNADNADYEIMGRESSIFFEDERNLEAEAKSADFDRSKLLSITQAIVWSIVQAVSETFARPRQRTLNDEQESIHSNGYRIVVNDPAPSLPDAATLETGELVSKAHQDVYAAYIPKFTSNESQFGAQNFDSLTTASSQETQLASDQEYTPSLPRFVATESQDPLMFQSPSCDQGKVREYCASTEFVSSKSVDLENSRHSGQKMIFACEKNSNFTEHQPAITDFLLGIATGSANHNLKQIPLEFAISHADLRKVASTIKFSCFENSKEVIPLFSGLSLLHILCIIKNRFSESIYDDFIDLGCKPDEESSNGCNVYAFAACQGNFKAMNHISVTHSNIWKSTLCISQNTDRNLLHCIMDFALPCNYDSLFECLGPSICTYLCKKLNGVVASPVFRALKLGNYAFLQSISRQVYIWDYTTADVGHQRTFLTTMMTNPHAHDYLLSMLSNITSLESFILHSDEKTGDCSMMLQAHQMGYMNIVFHVLKQEHFLYFLELDKIESFVTEMDTRNTRSILYELLSILLKKHHANTVVMWHCIHLVTSLSHDEEMALDLLSTASLDVVKNHQYWRSFDRFTGESALHVAVKKGWTEIVLCLYDLGHDINPFCFKMQTPMHTSALHNSVKCIMSLNNLGAEASIESGDGKSPIACSIENKNIECSMEILNNLGSRKSVFRTDSKGLSPLMRALESKQLQVAHKILKQYPEQANFVSMCGTNVFHAAAPHLASVQQLVSWSSQERKDIWAFLQQKNNDGETPKDIAAHCGYLDSLRFFMQLYQTKGSMNAANSTQEMDVHFSESMEAFSKIVFSSPTSVHKFLSEHIDSVNCYDFYHRTPLILAVQAKNLQGVQDLVDAGADILATDTLGNSAMHYMYLSQKEQSLWMWEETTSSDTDPSDVLQCIIQRNSEDSVAKCLTFKNKAGITPFGLAVINKFYIDVALLCGEVKFPKRLLNVKLPNGTYCLHVACSQNLINLAVIFLNLGSDPSVFDSNGMSPEYICRSHGHNSITLILMQFCNVLKIQCAVRSYLCRLHALANRADCIAVQNVVFKMIENTSAPMQLYADLRINFPRGNWNAIEHPKYPDMVPLAYAAM